MDFETRQRLAESVRRARGEQSQRQFAKSLGVSFPAVRSWEEGESIPGLENMEAIAAALGMPLELFLAEVRGVDVAKSEPNAEAALRFISSLPKAELIKLMHRLIELLGQSRE